MGNCGSDCCRGKKLSSINHPAHYVWDTLFDSDTYSEWSTEWTNSTLKPGINLDDTFDITITGVNAKNRTIIELNRNKVLEWSGAAFIFPCYSCFNIHHRFEFESLNNGKIQN